MLELAGFAVPNIFMGHNLWREGEVAGLSLGAYSGYSAIGLGGYRFVAKYPSFDEMYLFADGDTRQENELSAARPQDVATLKATLDTLVKISDYSLEKGL